jgi:Ser/Thr protein kinase RdoA (MazF antagonist)
MTDRRSVWAASGWDGPDAAAAALQHYGLPPDAGLRLISLSENAAYRVTGTGLGKDLVLRLHRPGYRNLAEIQSELAWIEAIRAQTQVVSPAIHRTVRGEAVCTFNGAHGPQHAVAFDFAAGAAPADADLIATSARLGSIAATLHLHAAAWAMPPHFVRPVWDVETAIGTTAHWGSWRHNIHVGAPEHVVLGAADAAVRQRIAGYGSPSRRWGLIHGDMRQANLLVDDTVTRLIDFDDCGFSWHMYDLACTLTFIEHRADVESILAALLGSYLATVTLEVSDLAIIPSMVMLRRLLLVGWFATHSHAVEAKTERRRFVTDTVGIAERYLAGGYLRRPIAP